MKERGQDSLGEDTCDMYNQRGKNHKYERELISTMHKKQTMSKGTHNPTTNWAKDMNRRVTKV